MIHYCTRSGRRGDGGEEGVRFHISCPSELQAFPGKASQSVGEDYGGSRVVLGVGAMLKLYELFQKSVKKRSPGSL